MTNNLEDFEHPDMDHEEPPRRGVGSNLAEAWRSKPLFKLMVVMIVVGAIVAAGVGFFSGAANKSTAGFLKPPDMNEAPGGKASPYLKEQTELANQQRTNEALKSGGSAIPTPVGQTADINGLGTNDKKNEALNELRAEVDNMNRQLKETKQQQPPQQQQQQPFDDSLAQAMQHQMSQLMEGWTPHGEKVVTVTKPEDEAKNAKGQTPAEAAAAEAAAVKPKIIVSAGTVSYAQLLTEANSDVPGPILAQIVSGPLSGARAVGGFQVANGTADYLVLQFKVADMKGKDYAINAIALDPDTTLGGMATEVDQRYFTRVVLPAAAGFLQGFGSALGQGDTSITTNGTTSISQTSSNGVKQGLYTGLGQAAQTASQFFQNQANLTRPLVRVAAGTPMGMFFVTSVTDQQPEQTQQQAVPAGYGYTPNPYGLSSYQQQMGMGYGANQPYGAQGYNQVGTYPGTTVTGYGQNTGAAQSVPYPNYANPGYGASPSLGYNSGLAGASVGYNGSPYYPR